MDFSKLYRISRFNSWQYIAFTGLLMSAGAEAVLRYLVQRPLPTGFYWLYACWAGLFVVGGLVNVLSRPNAGGHHHH